MFLDEKIEGAEKEYKELDCKGIELSSKDFRQKCYLSCKIAEMINERCAMKKQLADYNLETSRINKDMYECEKYVQNKCLLKGQDNEIFK